MGGRVLVLIDAWPADPDPRAYRLRLGQHIEGIEPLAQLIAGFCDKNIGVTGCWRIEQCHTIFRQIGRPPSAVLRGSNLASGADLVAYVSDAPQLDQA